MNINLMVFAAPMFIGLILIEWFISIWQKKPLYQLNDAINNISSGLLEEIAILPLRGLTLFSYYYLYEHYAWLHIDTTSVVQWIILWVLVDFCYYWYHRLCHRNNLFWIGHSVHHQSEAYNLSVALRQGIFQAITSWFIYLPLALLGFPTWMFVIVVTLNTIYQFWIHTQTIKTMGWFEYLFNTPSHHRVHHGKNPQYIDKNYAGSLIIWDKLFGTFTPEEAPVEYGVTEPLHTWNPLVANIKVIQDLLHYGQYFKNKWRIVQAFFKPPEWIMNQLAAEGVVVEKRVIRSKNTESATGYMIINIVVAISLYAYLSFTFSSQDLSSWVVICFIIATLVQIGRVANGSTNQQMMEFIRALFALLLTYLQMGNLFFALLAGLMFYSGNQFLLSTERFDFAPTD